MNHTSDTGCCSSSTEAPASRDDARLRGSARIPRVGGSRPSVRVRRERTPSVGSCPNLSSGRWWLRVAAFALRPATRAAGVTDTRGGLHMEARRGHVALAARPGVGASIISAQQHCCCAKRANHPHNSTAALWKRTNHHHYHHHHHHGYIDT